MSHKGVKYLLAALLFSACTENDLLLKEQETFAVQFSMAGVSAEVTTRTFLANDVTLRILAFRRKSSTPDLTVDEYAGEGVYKAGGGNGALTAVSPLLLQAGTYDFYALTPALTVTRPGNSGGGSTYTVSVEHGTDYATSLTEQRAVSESAPAVTLNELQRQCTRLGFALSPQSNNITKVEIVSAGLTNMTDAPVKGQLNKPLSVETAGRTTSLNVTGFTAVDASKPLELSTSAVVLPRSAAAFNYQMKVKFNGSTQVTDLQAKLPEDLVLKPGYSYTFTVKLKGLVAELILTVEPWTDVHWDSANGNPADTGGGNTQLMPGAWEGEHSIGNLNGGELGE